MEKDIEDITKFLLLVLALASGEAERGEVRRGLSIYHSLWRGLRGKHGKRFPTHAGAGPGAGSAIKGKKVEEDRRRRK